MVTPFNFFIRKYPTLITFFAINRYNLEWELREMNKKDIAAIRRQFKLDNELMHIETIFNVYVQKESGDIYHHVSQPFELLDQEAQELFLVNFKKVLAGQLDTKLFELKFKKDVEESTQDILFDGLQATEQEEWQDYMLEIVEKMYAHNVYEFDTVVTFITGEYRKPMKQRNPESGEGGTDQVYANKFILCSLNKTSLPKSSLVFDYIEKEFKPNSHVDPIINLTTPLTGFLFPTFTDNAADVNHILYSAGKANELDERFIDDILNCEPISTAIEDKDCFELIVSNIAGEKINADVVSNIYEKIDDIIEIAKEDDDEEEPTLNYRDVEKILTTSGIEGVKEDTVKEAFKTVIDDELHSFKANNLIPTSIKIDTEIAKLSIKPQDLKNVKYITYNGKRCLLLEIDEDVVIEGFQLESAPFS